VTTYLALGDGVYGIIPFHHLFGISLLKNSPQKQKNEARIQGLLMETFYR
jgi:hypothetical protein